MNHNLKGLIGAVLGVGFAIFAVATAPTWTDWLDDKLGDQPYKDKIGDVKDEFGDDANVILVTAGNGGATFEIQMPNKKVQVRKFSRLCSGGDSSSCDYENDEFARGPAPDDDGGVRLGDLDKNLLNDMADDAGVDDNSTLFEFDGQRWKLTDSSSTPPTVFTAAPDGSNVRPVKNG